ncbi:MAG: SMI1/KNR4 family protein [Planctomycetes bacterium]|nr:SMI1/KNR4 family protein [Planctomycetota bacterium]
MDVVQKLVRTWSQAGVAFGPGASESSLAAFETRHRVVLPADFRRYLQLVNGTGSGYDDDFYRFAPLGEVAPVADSWGISDQGVDNFAGCFVFADWAINCWDYALQLAGPEHEIGRVFCVEDANSKPESMASSFGEWLAIYLRDRDRLVPGAGA